jgi:hypothetical protein
MQTFPCSHRVVCRKCFVKTIQMAVMQRMLPLRCVICRSKILRLKQGVTGGISLPTSASQYCMGVGSKWEVPASASLYSMSSGASSLSGNYFTFFSPRTQNVQNICRHVFCELCYQQ